jgi:hypothetical protein
MRIPLICALLALLPFSSIRMVCVTAYDLATQTTASSAGAAQQADECARVCHRQPPAASPRPAAIVRCVLIADPACEFLAGAALAVLPSPPAFVPQRIVADVAVRLGSDYQPPSLRHHSPPPRLAA